MKIACLGDVMPGGVLFDKDELGVSDAILEYLSRFDIRVATLETAVGDIPSFDPNKMSRKMDVIYTPSDTLWRLKAMGINLVSLANNHAWDLGYSGLRNTQKLLDELSIQYCGAGCDIEEASSPAVIVIDGKTIAFLAFCEDRDDTCGYIPIAGVGRPGINPLYEEYVLSEIAKYNNRFDYLYLILHWGQEYGRVPENRRVKMAKRFLTAGANGIIGSHTHSVQTYVSMEGKPVFFSLGNTFFPDRYLNKPRPTWYPPKGTDTSDYPILYGYPWVEEPVLKKWSPVGRIGMIGEIEIASAGNRIGSLLVKLTDENSIDILEEFDYKGRIEIPAFFVKTGLYGLYYFAYRTINFIKRRLQI